MAPQATQGHEPPRHPGGHGYCTCYVLGVVRQEPARVVAKKEADGSKVRPDRSRGRMCIGMHGLTNVFGGVWPCQAGVPRVASRLTKAGDMTCMVVLSHSTVDSAWVADDID